MTQPPQTSIRHRPRIRLIGTLICASIVGLASNALAGKPQAVVIKDVTLFNTTSGRMQEGRTIVIEGERIHAVGTPESPVTIPEDDLPR